MTKLNTKDNVTKDTSDCETSKTKLSLVFAIVVVFGSIVKAGNDRLFITIIETENHKSVGFLYFCV